MLHKEGSNEFLAWFKNILFRVTLIPVIPASSHAVIPAKSMRE
jgi:hypothetical protein